MSYKEQIKPMKLSKIQQIPLPPLPKGGVSAFNDFKHLLPFGRTTTWRKSKNGEFPQGIRLNASMTVWRNDEILAWLENPNDWKGA